MYARGATPQVRTKTAQHKRRFAALMLSCLLVATAAASGGCSVRQVVARSVGDALAEGGPVYASDDDVELVGEALPFGLKTLESLIAQAPEHRPLLVAAASGFVQYAYAYVDLPAFEAEAQSPGAAREMRRRAKRLYLRGRGYALRALELHVPQFEQRLSEDPNGTLARLRVEHVPELYWAAAALAAAIASDKQDLNLVADLHLVEAMMQRALALDEAFNHGAVHQFLISFEGARPPAQGGSIEKARGHFERAMALADGKQIAPLVALAATVSVKTQDRTEFERLLRRALAFDVDTAPAHRLANMIAQKRARLLLSRTDDFFIGG